MCVWFYPEFYTPVCKYSWIYMRLYVYMPIYMCVYIGGYPVCIYKSLYIVFQHITIYIRLVNEKRTKRINAATKKQNKFQDRINNLTFQPQEHHSRWIEMIYEFCGSFKFPGIVNLLIAVKWIKSCDLPQCTRISETWVYAELENRSKY